MSKQQVINYKKGNAEYMRKWRAGKKQKEKEKLARERGLAAAIAQLQISHLNDFRKRLFPTLEHFKYHMSSSRQRHRPSTPLPLLTGSTPLTIHPQPVPSMGEIPHIAWSTHERHLSTSNGATCEARRVHVSALEQGSDRP